MSSSSFRSDDSDDIEPRELSAVEQVDKVVELTEVGLYATLLSMFSPAIFSLSLDLVHGLFIRWLLISLCADMEYVCAFVDLLKA